MNTEDQLDHSQKKKIFLIDDNADVLAVIKISLDMLGYDVTEFALGQDALDQFPTTQPDLLIVDQGLPDVEGLDIGRQIRSQESDSRCALILLTGSDGQSLRNLAKEIGFDDFLVKPVRINTLAECIERHLN